MITDGRPSVTTINNFLGLNMNETGETQLKLGEASFMKNFRITKDFKLEKMYGYKELYKPNNRVRANWVGSFRGNDVNIYVAGGKAYKGGTTPTQLGTLTDDDTTIFEFNRTLYFINGHDYKAYNGTIFANAKGYAPTIKTACTPAGVGTDLEPINLISAYRKVLFSGDGTSATYQLPEINISDVIAKVGGTTVTVTLNSGTGQVIFGTPPANGTNNVEIEYKTDNASTEIFKCKYAQTFGLAEDTRVFLYGNKDNKNRIYFSDLDITGVPNPTYFPANNFIDVGSSNDAVINISRQYDRLIVSKEAETYYMVYDPVTDTDGNTIIAFPTYPLNKSHGMVAYSQGQILDNYVTTIDASGVIQWTNTQSKDERNAQVISERVNEWLQARDLTKAVTMDYQEEKEYWLAIEKDVLIYNYSNGTFFTLELPDKVRTLTTFKGEIYMGTDTSIMKWDKNSTTYNGSLIDAKWEGGFYDFEYEYRRKTMRILWATIKPQIKTYMSINYISDRNEGIQEREIQSQTFSYTYWNYGDFMYTAENNVKPYRIKLKAKKFAFLKLIIKSNKIDYKLIVDSISIQKAYGGLVK